MASVFLSYDRRDGLKAKSIAEYLQRAGHTVWWDRQIKGGSQFSKEIEGALERADAIVVLWSVSAIESAWVRDEAAVGRDLGRMVPVRLDQALPPLGFRQYQTIDLPGGKVREGSPALTELLDTIGSLTGLDKSRAALSRPHLLTTLLTRRSVAAGLAALGVTVAAGFLFLRDSEPKTSPEVAALLAQAWQAWAQGSSEGNNQAIGLYRRATEIDPLHADAWGFLGCAYADRAQAWASAGERAALRGRARDAGRRALQIDPKNAYGRAAIAYAQPIRGNWLAMEHEFRRALRDQPGKWLLTYSLALLLTRVGRLSEAATLFGQLRGHAPTASQYRWHIQALWGSGQLEKADRLLEEAGSIYGTHPGIWLTRFDMLMYGGRPGAAIALAEDVQARPTGMSDDDLEDRLAVARAINSRSPAAIDKAIDSAMQQARQSAWEAARAIQNASALGRLSEAFLIADAYYFSRGFAVPDDRAAKGEAANITLDSRDTGFLFLPPAGAMRSDPRFERLVEEIGLTRYWRKAGAEPDYRRS